MQVSELTANKKCTTKCNNTQIPGTLSVVNPISGHNLATVAHRKVTEMSPIQDTQLLPAIFPNIINGPLKKFAMMVASFVLHSEDSEIFDARNDNSKNCIQVDR